MALKDVLLDPLLRSFAEAPYLDDVVAPGGREALYAWDGDGCLARKCVRLRCEERAGLDGGGPGDGVAADGVRFEDVGAPGAVVWRREE